MKLTQVFQYLRCKKETVSGTDMPGGRQKLPGESVDRRACTVRGRSRLLVTGKFAVLNATSRMTVTLD
jgi:hypothetical protein